MANVLGTNILVLYRLAFVSFFFVSFLGYFKYYAFSLCVDFSFFLVSYSIDHCDGLLQADVSGYLDYVSGYLDYVSGLLFTSDT